MCANDMSTYTSNQYNPLNHDHMRKCHYINTTDNYFSHELWNMLSSDKFTSSQKYAKFRAEQSQYKVLIIL